MSLVKNNRAMPPVACVEAMALQAPREVCRAKVRPYGNLHPCKFGIVSRHNGVQKAHEVEWILNGEETKWTPPGMDLEDRNGRLTDNGME